MKQNDATTTLLDQFVAFKRAWSDAGFAVDDIGADMQSVSNLVQAAKSQGFLEASKELQRLETETGMDYKTYEVTKRPTSSMKKIGENGRSS